MAKFIDLTGISFGRLKVLSRCENDNQGKAKWVCQCSCGKITVSTRNDLRNGDKKSCGCLRRELLTKDISGNRYGKLVALRICGKSTSNIWLCQCDCGNLHKTTINHLEMLQTKSCGCLSEKTQCEILEKAKQRFYENIKKENCWIWTGKIVRRYGMIFYKKNMKAHRFSYMVHKGKLEKGLFICHHCDNPLCVNPDHLYQGTAKDNHDDMVKRGRFKPRGKQTLNVCN